MLHILNVFFKTILRFIIEIHDMKTYFTDISSGMTADSFV